MGFANGDFPEALLQRRHKPAHVGLTEKDLLKIAGPKGKLKDECNAASHDHK